MSAIPARDPLAEIEASNPWYVDDQFAVQLGSPAFRAVVEERWSIFKSAIDEWARSQSFDGRPVRLLDAGCGDGMNLSFLETVVAERNWRGQLIGADYSPLRLDRARARLPRGLLRTSITSIGVRDTSFDVVICNQVLEHIKDDRSAFRELGRVLRPGGLLVVGVPNEGSLLGTIRNHMLQRSILRSTDHVNMYRADLLKRRMTDAGLQILRMVPQGFFVPHTVVHDWLNGWSATRRRLNRLAQRWPSCAASLFVLATRQD